MKKRNTDLTNGPITSQLIYFAIPLIIGAFIQQLYATVDMMFVGRAIGTSAAAAVGSSGMIINCIIAFFTGLSVGISIVVGKEIGSKKHQKINKVIHCAAALTLLFGFGLMVLGILLAPYILKGMNTPESLFSQALIYLRLYLCSLPSIVSYNIGTGIIKASGDSKSPTMYQFIGGIMNVIGNYVFIVVLHLGVVGAALTTIFSQTIAALLTIHYLMHINQDYRLRIHMIRMDYEIAIEILSVGVPSAIQAIMLSLSNLFVQSSINALEEVSIASFSAYYKVENIIYYPIMAIGQACSAFVSQNIGAGNLKRSQDATKKSILLGVPITLCISWIVILGAETAFSLFSKDIAVIQLGSQIARIAYPFYFIYVFLEVFSASIRGAGKAIPTMVITIVNMCGIRLVVLQIMKILYPGALGIAAVYPITWLTSALCMFAYYISKRWIPIELSVK